MPHFKFHFAVDGTYGNWTKSSSCSVTCGQGVELWMRLCDKLLGGYSENCSTQGAAYRVQVCKMKHCPGKHCFTLFS